MISRGVSRVCETQAIVCQNTLALPFAFWATTMVIASGTDGREDTIQLARKTHGRYDGRNDRNYLSQLAISIVPAGREKNLPSAKI